MKLATLVLSLLASGVAAPALADFDLPVLSAGAVKTTLVHQSATATTIGDVMINASKPPQCKMGGAQISQWFVNPFAADGKDVPIGYNIGDFTGFYPSNNYATQVGTSTTQYGGTGIQVENGNIGWQIETSTATPAGSAPSYIAGIVGNHSICDASGTYGTAHPFTNPNALLIASYDLQVPYSNTMYGTVNTASQMFYFIDGTHNLGFWYSAADYSSVNQSEQLIYDIGTTSAIVGTLVGKSGLYGTDVGNTRTTFASWKGYRTFQFAITGKNIVNAVAGLKKIAAQNPGSVFANYSKLSDNPADYFIGGMIIDTEVARVNNYQGGMGLSYKNVDISVYTGNRGCGPGRTVLAWTCGGGQPNASWVSSGGGCYQYDSGQACVNGD